MHIDPIAIQDAVRRRYAEAARGRMDDFIYPTRRAGAEALGYDPEILRTMPDSLLDGFCGVGNPFPLGGIRPGESVLDIGCGAGFDLAIASRLVGPTGRVCGVDLTPEMVARAIENLRDDAAARVSAPPIARFDVREGLAEAIPFDDATFDVVLSNGTLNLSARKDEALREIFRVLRDGGRLQFADVVVRGDLPPEKEATLDAWSR